MVSTQLSPGKTYSEFLHLADAVSTFQQKDKFEFNIICLFDNEGDYYIWIKRIITLHTSAIVFQKVIWAQE